MKSTKITQTKLKFNLKKLSRHKKMNKNVKELFFSFKVSILSLLLVFLMSIV